MWPNDTNPNITGVIIDPKELNILPDYKEAISNNANDFFKPLSNSMAERANPPPESVEADDLLSCALRKVKAVPCAGIIIALISSLTSILASMSVKKIDELSPFIAIIAQ